MTRLLSITAISMALFAGAASAQQASADGTEARERARNSSPCENIESNPNATHALIELCAWRGQYR